MYTKKIQHLNLGLLFRFIFFFIAVINVRHQVKGSENTDSQEELFTEVVAGFEKIIFPLYKACNQSISIDHAQLPIICSDSLNRNFSQKNKMLWKKAILEVAQNKEYRCKIQFIIEQDPAFHVYLDNKPLAMLRRTVLTGSGEMNEVYAKYSSIYPKLFRILLPELVAYHDEANMELPNACFKMKR